LIPLRASPSATSGQTASLPDKTELWAKCVATAEPFNESGYSSDKWLLIQGPGAFQGWISIAWVGRQTYGLPACPPVAATPTTATTEPPPTTAAPTTVATTVPTTAVPTTVTTLPTTTSRPSNTTTTLVP